MLQVLVDITVTKLRAEVITLRRLAGLLSLLVPHVFLTSSIMHREPTLHVLAHYFLSLTNNQKSELYANSRADCSRLGTDCSHLFLTSSLL